MKKIPDLNLGFNDAENYRRKENKQLFNQIFVRGAPLDQLLNPSTFFLIGEKGTGKTAYAVYLSNNNYAENKAELKYLRETDYQKFITLKQEKHLQLSDYAGIWKVIILLLLTKSIQPPELEENPFSKNNKIKALWAAIDEYYKNAFSPEIIHALDLVENSHLAAEIMTKNLRLGGDSTLNIASRTSRFQVNLLFIQQQFERALSDLKLKSNHILFIDGIDVRPGRIPYEEYLDCVKGLANAVWELNNDFFANIKDKKARFRTILLVRPDILNSLSLQNQTNKIRDNSVLLDWRTTYPNYRSSSIFELIDKMLRVQQPEQLAPGQTWDYYFPWESKPTNPKRAGDPSFFKLLRLSYSRPRDMVTMLQILQEEAAARNHVDTFPETYFNSMDFQNKYSEYLLGGIKDQLSFYYTNADYDMFLRFFMFLDGKAEFFYNDYLQAYNKFTNFILNHHTDIPEFVETSDKFLQFLYDTNIVCYIEDMESEPLFRFCYRERSPANISPKIKLGSHYRVHYGLLKALNLGYAWNK